MSEAVRPLALGELNDPLIEARVLISDLDEVQLPRYRIVGNYVRFDDYVRNSLKDMRQRVISALNPESRSQENFLLWGQPGSGKSFLVQQVAKSMGNAVKYGELNLAQLDDRGFRSELERIMAYDAPCVCLIDEIDSKPLEPWPYEALLPYLEPSRPRTQRVCFILAGSGGATLQEMKQRIASRPKGADLLSRIPHGNEFIVPSLNIGDRVLVSIAQLIQCARESGREIHEVEKLVLYYIAVNPNLNSARQLHSLATRTADRMPKSEDRIKYDYLFEAGDPENKKFWHNAQSTEQQLIGVFTHVADDSTSIPLSTENQRPIAQTLEPHRIAVLPFVNISPDPNDAYFADGLTEELIAKLSTISGLKVIARTSIMRFKGTTKGVGEIGKELRAGTILEGSVRKAANRLRITAQLIDASSEEHLWVENYDRQLEDVFAIQTELAENVADALKTQMLGEEKEHIEKKPTKDIGAYEFYLKGRYYWNERNKESLEKAIKYFEEAIKRDPRFAFAYSGLADSYSTLVDHWYLSRSEGLPKAEEAARKALALDETLAEAHTSLANILNVQWDWRGAEEEYAKALKRNPNYATAHHWYSIYLLELGRLDEAIKELKIADELDPLSPMIHTYAGSWLYFCARQYDVALAELDKALELDPNFVPAHTNRVWVYLAKSMFKEALAELERVLPSYEPLSTAWKAYVGFVYAIVGRTEEAKQILRECEEASAHERAEDVNHRHLALIHLKLRNKDRALEWLEKGFEARTITPFLVRLWPFFDEISSDPRFDELMKKTLRSLKTTV